MAIQTINIGTSANKGDGDPLRVAFDKINKNFAELDVANTVKDIKGSVFADDSTVLVDSVNGTLNASALSGSLPAIDGSALTGLTVSTLAYSSLTGTPTTISGYGITDAYTKTEVDNAITSSVLPSGSAQSIDVVAQDSTVLVDSVNGTLNATTLTGALPAIDGSALTGVLTAGGDFSGSIFADDSTLLVDGVNGKITGLVDTTQVTSPLLTLSSNTNISVGNIGDINKEAISINTIDATSILYGSRSGTTLGGSGAGTNFNYADDGTYRGGVMIPDVLTTSGKIPQLQINSKWQRNPSSNIFNAYTGGDSKIEIISDVVDFTGSTSVNFKGVQEKFATLTGSTGVVAHDCDNGHVFYHTGAAGDITANFTNLNSTQEYATNLTVIINQGATPYEVTAVQIGGAAQTINWQGGSAPTGNANGIDAFSFTILNDGGSYVVLGQMVDFT